MRKLLIGILAGIWGSAHAADESPIARPYIEVGDCWTYRAENIQNRGPINVYELCVSFVDYKKDVVLAVAKVESTEREIEISYTTDWTPHNSITGTVFPGGAKYYRWPLTVGDTYTTEVEWRQPQVNATLSGNITYSMKVVGWEDVKVPAGNFRAMKIEGRGINARHDSPARYPVAITLWFAREVQRTIKFEYWTGNNRVGEELVSYRLNK